MLRQRYKGLLQRIRQFRQNNRGMAIVEFALLLPGLLFTLLGTTELARYVLFNQKLSRVANVVADTTARSKNGLMEVDFEDMFKGAELIAGGADTMTTGRVIVTGVVGADDPVNPGGSMNTLAWRRCYGSGNGTTSILTNTSAQNRVALPSNIVLPRGEVLVIAEVALRYEPLFLNLSYMGNVLRMFTTHTQRQRAIYAPRGVKPTTISPSIGVTARTCPTSITS
jgi:hypothetical protein